jgi:hypothetical protein
MSTGVPGTGEDRQAIAKQCATSVEMLERSYSFAIEDLEDEGPRPAEEERLRARQAALAARRVVHGASPSRRRRRRHRHS